MGHQQHKSFSEVYKRQAGKDGVVAGLRRGSGALDVPVVAVTLAVTRLFDLPLQQSWQESRLPQSSLTQQRQIRPSLRGRQSNVFPLQSLTV